VVLISLEDYNSLEETAYLTRSPVNAGRLLSSIKEMEEGKIVKKKIRDLTRYEH
jgi:antitoxin YefM